MPQAIIQAIGTATPRYRATQQMAAEFMQNAARARSTSPADVERTCSAIGRVYQRSAIHYRNSVIPDYATDPAAFTLYPPNWDLDPFPSTADRMRVYQREAPALAREAVERFLAEAPAIGRERVTHLVVTSCTGFFAPGIDIALVKDLGLRRDVRRELIGFMGCYAAFNALRSARAVCLSEPGAVVLVVCVELCSLHFQRELSMDNIVANCIFGDGAAAVLVTGDEPGGRLALLDSHTLVADDSEEQMTWTVTDTGFQMTLAATVPTTLHDTVEPFLDELLGRSGLGRDRVDFWAIHPGGRRIVDAIRRRLDLPPEAVEPSFEVLGEHGNMSSPTVLFVLERCLARRPAPGAYGVAMAFGPGLTLESMLLRAL